MKFEENWLRGYRGEVVQRCERTDDNRWQVITIAHPEPCSGELKTKVVSDACLHCSTWERCKANLNEICLQV